MRHPLDPHDFGYSLGTTQRPKGVELWSRADKACRVIGPMGSGKTMRFFAPIIRHWAGPVLATSTKPDLVELTLDARRRDSRPVMVFDPQNIAPSLPKFRWTPITGASETEVAMMRAKAFVAGSRTPGSAAQSSEGSAFYKGQASKILAAFFHAAALDGANLDWVLKWARKLTDPAPLGILNAHPGAGPGWADMLRTATTGDGRTVGNTASTLDAALEPLMHQSVIQALQGDGEDPTDFNEFLDADGTIYLLGKDSEVNSVAPLTTAIAEDLLDIAEAHAIASPAGRLDPPLLAALDEAPNIAPIPSLRQRVADGRGRGITVIYGLQGWASARARFGEDTANELASFTNNVVVFGGAKDPVFLKDMSDLCGQVERERTTKTTTGGDRGGHSTATHMALEPVLRGDEIRALPEGHALLLADNLPPVITRLDGMWTWETWAEIEDHVRALRTANEAERSQQATAKKNQAKAHAATWAGQEEASAA
ncbi:type IV secretory system conjugative DNA transfer family protein [Streptomyces scabiei]|uniref:type IV secretory system conjugative DNA transfer family protein n=1 Tax=Streptomyces scabiei TaxID=1930 RepID=UPI0029A8109D|nr:TraM recognition domain-containing protein [Streptomyces scabiei]MDX2531582.1 TraM recognition domain-containing protein [Streptomyces scabiei]MDX2796640.1 TraM recognition domain-containing protein [Streptomyces scabiei]MDX2855876.1 TraM recognition domain-containing protein [Streptomyces scabiei]MDX3824572.1 TraM recognition domain-containing protein [Streptomyces scabiei]